MIQMYRIRGPSGARTVVFVAASRRDWTSMEIGADTEHLPRNRNKKDGQRFPPGTR
ncbi:MAG: hypothetical protein GXX84_14340 [Acidobacteria bacterium]|nr:hypothetical protein [Acidobacteriota bacterium]